MRLASLLLALAACTGASARDAVPGLATARQLVLVTTPGWNASTGTLRRYQRQGLSHVEGAEAPTRTGRGFRPSHHWHEIGQPVAVTVGRAGSAWGIGLHAPQRGVHKREGDGRAPAGVFAIGTAFGYGADAATGIEYAAMDADDWCIDVPASPLYNTIVDARDVGTDAIAGSTEPMRRDIHVDGDLRYELGFVVAHNGQRVAGAGSCIFVHAWKAPGEPTAGCTAMPLDALRELLSWLDRDAQPMFVLLPEAEHARLARQWALPNLR